jgi:hypothetical protein
MSQSVVVMQSDGSNPQTLDATSIFGTLMAPSVSLSAIWEDSVHAIILVQGLGTTGHYNYSGATLRAVEASTRNPLVTYGALPTVSGMLMVMPDGLNPAHYGQTGLLRTISFGGAEENTGLIFVDTDAAGLTVITPPMVATGVSRMRPAQRYTLPVGTTQRQGLAHVKGVRRTSSVLVR